MLILLAYEAVVLVDQYMRGSAEESHRGHKGEDCEG